MKKRWYLLAMLMLGVGGLLCPGCSEDGPGEEEEGKKEQSDVVKKLTLSNYDSEEKNEITVARANGLITGITWKVSPLGGDDGWEPYTVEFAVATAGGKADVTFKDEEGTQYSVAYTLDAKGIATSASVVIKGMEDRAMTWTFANNSLHGMLERLTRTIPGQGSDEVFEAVCDKEGNWNRVMDFLCELSDVRNTASVNLNLVGTGLVDIENPVLSVAVLCGWVRANPLLVSSITGEDENDEGEPIQVTFKFTPQKTAGKISSLGVKILQGDAPEMDYISATLEY